MPSYEAVFLNTRVRLQRLADAKFFSGWVKEFTQKELVVRMSAKAQSLPDPGDQFMVQVHGHTSTALFKASLSVVSDLELHFRIPEPVRFLNAHEPVRVSVAGVSALITASNRAFEAVVVDLSSNGAGLVSDRELAKGDHVRIAFTSPAGPIECGAEVRYCKPESIEQGNFRLGLLLEDLGRIERARWNRLVEQNAA